MIVYPSGSSDRRGDSSDGFISQLWTALFRRSPALSSAAVLTPNGSGFYPAIRGLGSQLRAAVFGASPARQLSRVQYDLYRVRRAPTERRVDFPGSDES